MSGLSGFSRLGDLSFDWSSIASPLTAGVTGVLQTGLQIYGTERAATLAKQQLSQQQALEEKRRQAQQQAAISGEIGKATTMRYVLMGAVALTALGVGGYLIYRAVKKR